ncbi:hypothetical protein SMICM17S_01246 [Streptomyces microflavus]
MNGVHCQTRAAATAISGISEVHSGWAIPSIPKRFPNQLSAPLKSPYSGL